jgi:hypothetical protein
MMSPAQRDAALVYDSTQGLGTRDVALIGIICSRTPSQIYEIRQAFNAMYRTTLERQIEGDTSGDYRKVSGRSQCKCTLYLHWCNLDIFSLPLSASHVPDEKWLFVLCSFC